LAGKTACEILEIELKIEHMSIVATKTPLEIATDAAAVHCKGENLEVFSSFEDRVFWFASYKVKTREVREDGRYEMNYGAMGSHPYYIPGDVIGTEDYRSYQRSVLVVDGAAVEGELVKTIDYEYSSKFSDRYFDEVTKISALPKVGKKFNFPKSVIPTEWNFKHKSIVKNGEKLTLKYKEHEFNVQIVVKNNDYYVEFVDFGGYWGKQNRRYLNVGVMHREGDVLTFNYLPGYGGVESSQWQYAPNYFEGFFKGILDEDEEMEAAA
jgi:hypothetical protein